MIHRREILSDVDERAGIVWELSVEKRAPPQGHIEEEAVG